MHARRRRTGGRVVGLVAVDAEDVVDVPVREHDRVQRQRRPVAHRVVHDVGEEVHAGVDEHEPVIGRDAVDVGEAVDERDAVRDLGPAARAAERVVVGLALPDPLRQCEDVGHGLRIRARS